MPLSEKSQALVSAFRDMPGISVAQINKLIDEGADPKELDEDGRPVIWRILNFSWQHSSTLLELLKERPEILMIHANNDYNLLDHILVKRIRVDFELIEFLIENLPETELFKTLQDDSRSGTLICFSLSLLDRDIKERYKISDLLLKRNVPLPPPQKVQQDFENVAGYLGNLLIDSFDFYIAYRQNPSFPGELRDEQGKTLLHHSFSKKYSTPITPYLLAQPADVDLLNLQDNDDNTPLHELAKNLDSKYSLEHDVIPAIVKGMACDFSLLNKAGDSALHIFAKTNPVLLIPLLIRCRNIDVNVCDEAPSPETVAAAISGESFPTRTAFFYREADSWRCVLAGGGIDDFLDVEIETHDPAVHALSEIMDDGYYEVYLYKNPHLVVILLNALLPFAPQRCIDVNVLSESGLTILSELVYAACKVDWEFFSGICDIILVLIACGANPFLPVDYIKNPLMRLDLLMVTASEVNDDGCGKLKKVRKAMTYDYGMQALNIGDFKVAASAFDGVRREDDDYFDAVEMSVFVRALIISADDGNEKSLLAALPNIIKFAKQGNRVAIERRNKIIKRLYNLPDNTTDDTLDEYEQRFFDENGEATVQKDFRLLNPDIDYENSYAVCLAELRRSIDLKPEEKVILLTKIKAIIRLAIVKENFDVEDELISKILDSHYRLFYDHEAVYQFIRELADVGSSRACEELLEFSEDDSLSDENINDLRGGEETHKRNMLTLAKSHEFKRQWMGIVGFYEASNEFYGEKITPEFLDYIYQQLPEAIKERDVNAVHCVLCAMKIIGVEVIPDGSQRLKDILDNRYRDVKELADDQKIFTMLVEVVDPEAINDELITAVKTKVSQLKSTHLYSGFTHFGGAGNDVEAMSNNAMRQQVISDYEKFVREHTAASDDNSSTGCMTFWDSDQCANGVDELQQDPSHKLN